MFYDLLLQFATDFGQQECWIGALIGGIASLAGGIMGMSSTSSTNETNAQIARWKTKEDYKNAVKLQNLQYQLNKQAAQQQQDYTVQNTQQVQQWQERMRQQEWDYNTPASQMQRFQQAGLNPYNAFGSISGQGTSSIASSPAMQQGPSFSVGLPSAPVTGYTSLNDAPYVTGMFSTIADMINDTFHDPLTNPSTREAEHGRIKADSVYRQTISDLEKMMYDNKITASELQNEILKHTKEKTKFESVSAMWNAYMAEDRSMILPEQLQIELFTMGAQYSNLIKHGYLTEQQAELALQSALKAAAETTGQKLQNDYFQKSSKYLLRSCRIAADISNEELKNLREYGVREVPDTYEYDVRGGVKGGLNNGLPSFNVGAEGSYKARAYKKRKR